MSVDLEGMQILYGCLDETLGRFTADFTIAVDRLEGLVERLETLAGRRDDPRDVKPMVSPIDLDDYTEALRSSLIRFQESSGDGLEGVDYLMQVSGGG